jgi:hypothetical protein
MNPYHSFLIKHRIYCERCSDLTAAVVVRNYNGRDTVLCSAHAGRLDAARMSDNKQNQPQLKLAKPGQTESET